MDKLMPMLKAALDYFNLNSHQDDFKYHVLIDNKLIETQGGGAAIIEDLSDVESVLLKKNSICIVLNDKKMLEVSAGGEKKIDIPSSFKTFLDEVAAGDIK